MKRNLVLVQMAFLIAIQAILTMTPLGFITIGLGMTITFMHLPVLIGAMVIGPVAGGVLGFVFGLFSMIKATNFGTPDSLVFSPFHTGSFYSVIISIVPRVLFGLITAYLFIILKNIPKISQSLRTIITVTIATLSHTILVLSGIYFLLGDFFAKNIGQSKDTLIKLFLVVLGTNGLIEVGVAILVCFKLVPTLINVNLKEN